MPHSKLVKIGVWENDRFIGVVIFGSGARDYSKTYGLKWFEICELVRVALREHQSPVTQIMSIALRMLKKQSPKLRLVISFADRQKDHVGKIYQAGNWIYTGASTPAIEYIFRGRRWHGRALRSSLNRLNIQVEGNTLKKAKSLDPTAREVWGSSKFRYLMPLDDEMRDQITVLKKPYPKSVSENSTANEVTPDDTAGVHPAEGGSTPTRSLQVS